MVTTRMYESPDGLLRLLIIRDDAGDVLLGFDEYPWHAHGDQLATTYGVSLEEAIECFLKDLTSNRTVIAISKSRGSVSDIWVTDDPQGELRHKLEDESIEFRHWDESAAR